MRIDFTGLCFTNASGLHFAHDPVYMLLSYLIAATGSYTALKLVDWLRHCPARSARFWHLAASATLGGSIWAMHFMGMLAVRINLPMSFEPKLTLTSLVIAVGVAALGLRMVLAGAHSSLCIGAAGVVLGLGIAAMHYVGMAALQLPGSVAYVPRVWIASVLIAMGAAVAALCLALRDGRHRVPAALAMAAAICGMHYTGMAAAVIRVDPLVVTSAGIQPGPLAIAVSGVTLALLLLALVSVAEGGRFLGKGRPQTQRTPHNKP
jgi:diguanylate cyclase